jgi:hypothetical protein
MDVFALSGLTRGASRGLDRLTDSMERRRQQQALEEERKRLREREGLSDRQRDFDLLMRVQQMGGQEVMAPTGSDYEKPVEQFVAEMGQREAFRNAQTVPFAGGERRFRFDPTQTAEGRKTASADRAAQALASYASNPTDQTKAAALAAGASAMDVDRLTPEPFKFEMPRRQAPVRGTPEYMQMLEDEEKLKSRFRPSSAASTRPEFTPSQITGQQRRIGSSEAAFNAMLQRRPDESMFTDETGNVDKANLQKALGSWRSDSTATDMARQSERDVGETMGIRAPMAPARAPQYRPDEAAEVQQAAATIQRIAASTSLAAADKAERIKQVNARLKQALLELRANR